MVEWGSMLFYKAIGGWRLIIAERVVGELRNESENVEN